MHQPMQAQSMQSVCMDVLDRLVAYKLCPDTADVLADLGSAKPFVAADEVSDELVGWSLEELTDRMVVGV